MWPYIFQLLKQLESADEKIAPLIDETLEKIRNGETLVPEPEVTTEKRVKQSRKKRYMVIIPALST